MERERSLDGLRGIAVLSVICVHTGVPFVPGGTHGVDMFFVLSGYLITSILMAEIGAGGLRYWRFWQRRALRLMPALLALLAFYVAAAPILYPEFAADRWREAFFAGAYLMDYVSGRYPNTPLTHTWSLAIEAQFYLLWPLVALGLARVRSPGLALLMAWGALTLLRIGVLAATMDIRAAFHPLHVHATGLVLGAALACAPRFKAPPWLAWLGVIGFAFLLVIERDAEVGVGAVVWGVACAELATAAVIAGLSSSPSLDRLLSWRPLATLGLISYGVYLWQTPIAVLTEGLPWWWRAIIVTAGSILVAAISYWTVEWPARLRRKRPGPPASDKVPATAGSA